MFFTNNRTISIYIRVKEPNIISLKGLKTAEGSFSLRI